MSGTVRELYRALEVPPNLQRHMLRAAAVAEQILETWSGPELDGERVLRVLLVHDLGNILKADYEALPEMLEEEQAHIERWRGVQARYRARFGEDADAATRILAAEAGLGEAELSLLSAMGFWQTAETLERGDREAMLAAYADHRVGPFGVLSQQERFEEARERYREAPGRPMHSPRAERMIEAAYRLEAALFAHLPFAPSAISDASVGPRLEGLLDRPWGLPGERAEPPRLPSKEGPKYTEAMREPRPEELDLPELGADRGARFSPILREDAEAVVEELGALMAPLAGKAILVTGAAGFLCSHLLDVLAAFNAHAASSGSAPCQIIALDNFKIGPPSRLAHLEGEPSVRILDHDVTRPFPAELPADYVIHGAGIASPTFYRRFPLETIAVNVDGLRNALDHARSRDSQQAIYLSTSEIYGDPDPAHIPTPESYRGSVSCTGPRACYDESKRLGETIAMVLRRKEGLPVRVLRPFNVYGPGQRLDDRRMVPDMMRSALAGQPLVLLSDGRATRSFCYLRDAIRGTLFALLSPSEHAIFNVGNDEGEVAMRDLAAAVAEVAAEVGAQGALPVRYQESEDADYLVDNPQRRCPDLGRLRGLGYAPTVPLRAGLARTLASYRSLARPS